VPDDSLDNTAVPESTAGSAAPKAAEKKHNKPAVTYADAGVDISSGDRAKQRIKMLARKTFNKQVLSEIGGFGGLFALDLEKFPQPVLVSSSVLMCALLHAGLPCDEYEFGGRYHNKTFLFR